MQLNDASFDHASFLLGYKSAFVETRDELAEMALRFALEIEACRNELAELRRLVESKGSPLPANMTIH